jgi:hypothetical protein
MAEMNLEIEGTVDEVIQVLRKLGRPGHRWSESDAGRTTETALHDSAGTEQDGKSPVPTLPEQAMSNQWTVVLAADFETGLDGRARRVLRQAKTAGKTGIHRSVLCRRAELEPAELRSVLIGMGHALRRFRQKQGGDFPHPLAANQPMQTYFIDPEFAAAWSALPGGGG